MKIRMMNSVFSKKLLYFVLRLFISITMVALLLWLIFHDQSFYYCIKRLTIPVVIIIIMGEGFYLVEAVVNNSWQMKKAKQDIDFPLVLSKMAILLIVYLAVAPVRYYYYLLSIPIMWLVFLILMLLFEWWHRI